MKNYVTLIVVAVLAVLIAFWVGTTRIAKAPIDGVACTQEAKLCPDGSAVGRTGPNCQFAPCPSSSGTLSLSLEATIGQKVTGQGVSIVPTEVLEDSRCPIDVVCIQAGTVRIKALLVSGLGEANQEFKLGVPVTTEAETVTLTNVSPVPKSTVQIQNSDYLFTFLIAKRTISGVRGTVELGPTCPVMRDPPDPQCADKPYATTITVYRTGLSTVFATGKSDAAGTFTFSLAPGSYTLVAAGGTVLPRCSPVDVIVPVSGYMTANISCDTGIR